MNIVKRFTALFIALVLTFSLCLLLTACNGADNPGVSGNPGESDNSGESGNPGESDNPDGSDETNEAKMRQAYQEIYGKMSDLFMNTAIGSMVPSSTPSAKPLRNFPNRAAVLYTAPYTAEDEIYTDAVTNSTWFIGATTYVYLASELYKNETFVVTDSPVGYTVTPESTGTVVHTDVIMMSNMNAETGEVLLQLEFKTTEYRDGAPSYSDENYIYIDADYNFTEKEVNTLLIHIWSLSNSNLILSAKYSNGTFRHMNKAYAQEVTETVTALRSAYESKFNEKVQLGDYTAEFERANEYMENKIEEMLGQ